jgi:hypothetical protein
MSERDYEKPVCGFCGTPVNKAVMLIKGYHAGRTSYICNDCVHAAWYHVYRNEPDALLLAEVERLGT